MNSDIEDMGLILVESTFRHRKEVERLERTLLRDRRVKYFNTLNDITTDLQGKILTFTIRDSWFGIETVGQKFILKTGYFQMRMRFCSC